MSFTYAELKQAIKDYTEYEETSFVANLPLFIRMSEERILKNIQLSLFRKNATASTGGTRFLESSWSSKILALFRCLLRTIPPQAHLDTTASLM